jgi:sigma-54 dependent transcriptional regulator, acetoin dehydrogenase operon transcriptional activator AcoR
MLDMRSVHAAREQYISTGTIPERLRPVVRTEIAVSWARSRESGARPDVAMLPRPAHDCDDGAAALRQAARPVLDRLAESLEGLPGSVLLADNRGRLIDGRTTSRSAAALFESGASCSESLVGTNGIGTALADGYLKVIKGPEHWAEINTGLTCIAVPVIHPVTHRPAAAVALSTPCHDVHPSLNSLLQWSALGIRQALLEQSSELEHLLLRSFLARRKQDRPRLLLSKNLLLADPVAAELLPDVDAGQLWEELAARRTDQSVTRELKLADGAVVLTLVTPLALGNADQGLLLEVQQQRRAPQRRSTDRPVFSSCFSAAAESARAAAATARALLLTGEAGTGKATMARHLFASAERGGSPLVVDLRAADTDADGWDRGLRDAAGSAGVIFLLHLDQISASGAERLLPVAKAILANSGGPRLVATAAAVPVGDDPAVATATLELFAVFAGSTVCLPPLRDRLADLPGLVREMTVTVDIRTRWTSEALDVLLRCAWPGNLRELSDVVTRTLAQATGFIRKADLPLDVRQQIGRTRLTLMERTERDMIMATLEASRGNKVIAADELGISRSSLYRKIRRYGLSGQCAVAP